VQHRTAVAKSGDATAIEQMGVDTRDLWRRVSANAQGSAAQLVDEFERSQIEFAARSGQQGIEVLEQRRDDQLETVRTSDVEQRSAQDLDSSGFDWQNIGDVLGQEPGRRHEWAGK
jgi:hypothetical protein